MNRFDHFVLGGESALKATGADQSRIARTTADPASDAEARQVTVHLSLAAR